MLTLTLLPFSLLPSFPSLFSCLPLSFQGSYPNLFVPFTSIHPLKCPAFLFYSRTTSLLVMCSSVTEINYDDGASLTWCTTQLGALVSKLLVRPLSQPAFSLSSLVSSLSLSLSLSLSSSAIAYPVYPFHLSTLSSKVLAFPFYPKTIPPVCEVFSGCWDQLRRLCAVPRCNYSTAVLRL